MIEVVKLTKRFGSITAVNKVSFNVQKGDVLGFLGPNGAGKSTTIRVIAGFLPPTEGKVSIGGIDVSKDPLKTKKMTGYMPESTPLYKHMTAKECLRFIAESHGIAPIERRVEEIVETANLKEISGQLVETISKGYRSRLSFAAAIIHDPPVLLLDEPTDGLDPNQKNEIRALIKSLSRDKAIVVSTHILEEVDAIMCSRVIFISEGRIVLDGTPQDLRSRGGDSDKAVVSLKLEDRIRAEQALSAKLTPFGKGHDIGQRFIVEKLHDVSAIQTKLTAAGIAYRELYCFDAPLDEAFRNLTRTKE
ncbi:MAG: ABC transporter ATP-binding protein [Pseudomonadota bacterium]